MKIFRVNWLLLFLRQGGRVLVSQKRAWGWSRVLQLEGGKNCYLEFAEAKEVGEGIWRPVLTVIKSIRIGAMKPQAIVNGA